MPSAQVDNLLKRGVRMPAPETVHVGEEVDPGRISGNGVVIHPGCRIAGAGACLQSNVQLGEEGPATLVDCQAGPGVRLKGGFFHQAVFLAGASMGDQAHVRPGTILEEQASAAHCVGLKQTILFPFATLGSLINFCDCLLAGGTGRDNHSEVGSSYIHFNFTPQQDKATPSIMGDAPRGVMLREPPIFLGGQGGLVGPCRVEFGTVIAAGTVWRKDVTKPGTLLFDRAAARSGLPFVPGVYRAVKRIVHNNLAYVADLLALRLWHAHARPQFFSGERGRAVHHGLLEKCDMAIDERLKRFRAFCAKLPLSCEILQETMDAPPPVLLEQKKELASQGEAICQCLELWRSRTSSVQNGDDFLNALEASRRRNGPDYLDAVRGLSAEEASMGTAWLEAFKAAALHDALSLAPACQ